MIVIYSKKFRKKIKHILIQKGIYSKNAPTKMQILILEKVDILKMFPKAYPRIFLKNTYNLRKIPIDKYVILYTIIGDIISIKDIVHQKSNYLNNQD